MPTLQQVIVAVQANEGFVYACLRATDHQGMVKCYTAWFQRYDNRVRNFEVRILVLNEGQPGEAAYLYTVDHVLAWMTPPAPAPPEEP